MQAIFDWLNTAVFSIGGTPTTWAEILGFVTGALCVFLVARNNIWTFPVGILNAAFFFVLFIDARLYADAWLQVFFLVIQVVGWWAWLKAGPNRTKLKINNTKLPAILGTAVFLVVGFFVLTPILRDAHGAYPHWDASTTSLSIAAQALMSYKLLENWYLWIAADLIYIPLYWAKGLYFTSALYVVFLSLCVMGLLHWRKVRDGDAEGRGPNSSRVVDAVDAGDPVAVPRSWSTA